MANPANVSLPTSTKSISDVDSADPRSHLMRVLADVVGLFSIIVGSFSRNLGPSHSIFSANVVPNRRMLSRPTDYVLGPLQLSLQETSMRSEIPKKLGYPKVKGHPTIAALKSSYAARF